MPSAVQVLRESLAGQPDNSVVIVQVGFSTNLARLLQTDGDKYSSLSGLDLVEQKVKHISIMAGTFALIEGQVHLEYNIVGIFLPLNIWRKLADADLLGGFEVGLAIRYPAISIENDFNYLDRHPIPESYQLIYTPHESPPGI